MLTIKNWTRYQHYGKRRPPWIKLHSKILDAPGWRNLPDNLKGQLVAIWVLASRLHNASTDAEVPNDPPYLAALTGCKVTRKSLDALISSGFLAPCKHDASEVLPNLPKSGVTEPETYTKTTLSRQDATARSLLTFLNQKTGRSYRPVDSNLTPIMARLREGASEDEIRQVIARKCREWNGNGDMAQYLRPKTLFTKTNFWNYHGELIDE